MRNLSNNLRATGEFLSHMYYCFFAQTGDYTNTNAADMNSQITGLLANIESLIEAAQAVQYVSSSTTREVLKTSVALKDTMRKYKHDLERGIGGSEDNIGIDRPSVIYPRAFKSIMKRAKQSCSDLRNLESEVEAVSLMKTEEEKPAEIGQGSKIRKKRGRDKDPKVKRRNKSIAEYRALNFKLTWKEIGSKFGVSADTARKACNNPDT